jgi:hypothetical protein
MMLSAEEFVRRWETERYPPGQRDPLVRFPARLVNGLVIPDEDKLFLVNAGLPESAAPFLHFDAQKGESWSTLPGDLQPSDDYRRIYLIGSNGSGDPLAIDGTANGQIVELFHEFRFVRGFVNTSVRHLAECLLAFRVFVTAVSEANGEDAFLLGNIPTEMRTAIEAQLREIDEVAMTSKGLWREELDSLDSFIKDFHKPVADFSKGII